jgi:hypothetical protein
MKTSKIIKSWNSADFLQITGSAIINKNLMAEVQGGGDGYIKTISGECSKGTVNCYKLFKQFLSYWMI